MNLDQKNTYVLSINQGTICIDNSSNMVYDIQNIGFYTFELDASVYVVFCPELDGQYCYTYTCEVNLFYDMVTCLAGVTDLTKELAIYETMITLCGSVKVYRTELTNCQF